MDALSEYEPRAMALSGAPFYGTPAYAFDHLSVCDCAVCHPFTRRGIDTAYYQVGGPQGRFWYAWHLSRN